MRTLILIAALAVTSCGPTPIPYDYAASAAWTRENPGLAAEMARTDRLYEAWQARNDIHVQDLMDYTPWSVTHAGRRY